MLGHDECIEKLKTLRRLRTERSELEKKAKDLKEQEELLNTDVTEYFEMTGQQSIDLEGYGKFYLNREIYPNVTDMEAVQDWLDNRGDLDLIMTFNTNKFKAYFKEKVANNEELPPCCEQFVRTKVRMRST
jgi:hypothetical protein